MAQSKSLGKQTIMLDALPSVLSYAAIVGKKEGEGPLSSQFDEVVEDAYFGTKSWEKAESALLFKTVSLALEKGGLSAGEIRYIFAGDLLDQCIGTTYAVRELQIPYFGLYGACSTMAEGLSLAAMAIDGGFAEKVVAATGSHFCSAEKQFRYPLEYGGQRTPTAQWTVTGSGAVVLGKGGAGPFITHITTGRIVDMGIKDVSNMGAAMAPAFADTVNCHLLDTGRAPADYDLILSGDLGAVGGEIALDRLDELGWRIEKNYKDCGMLIFDNKKQDTHAGGSGCGCSASVLCADILPKMRSGELKNVLFVATGALMSPTSILEGESIPSIAHAVSIASMPV